MAGPTLVLSDPPHASQLNLAAAAPLLDLKPEELRPKSNYGVPEIWLAEEHQAQANGYARALGLAGLSLTVIDASALVAVPDRTLIAKFEFTGTGFEVRTATETVKLPYDQRILGIYFKAAEPEPVPPFLDLYVYRQGIISRLSVEQGHTDLRGLLGERKISVVANMPTMVSTCVKRFPNLTMDRRLEGMRLRKRTGLPEELVEKRKGFSFATPQLAELLESLEPGFGDVSQPDLSSRLTFLTHVGEKP